MDISVIDCNIDALSVITKQLHAGFPVVLPNPSPLPYMVVGPSAKMVNRVKCRPEEQAVAFFVADSSKLAPYIGLGDVGSRRMESYLWEQKMTVLCPVKEGIEPPIALEKSIQDEYLLLFGAHLALTKAVCQQSPTLYVSSGNITGLPPLQRCAEVENQFHANGRVDVPLLIVNGDYLRDQSQIHGSTTMVKIWPNARTAIVRKGIQSK